MRILKLITFQRQRQRMDVMSSYSQVRKLHCDTRSFPVWHRPSGELFIVIQNGKTNFLEQKTISVAIWIIHGLSPRELSTRWWKWNALQIIMVHCDGLKPWPKIRKASRRRPIGHTRAHAITYVMCMISRRPNGERDPTTEHNSSQIHNINISFKNAIFRWIYHLIAVGFAGLYKMTAINCHPENRLFYGKMSIDQQQQPHQYHRYQRYHSGQSDRSKITFKTVGRNVFGFVAMAIGHIDWPPLGDNLDSCD